ncbi:MAG: xanthine dehydrogenase family protein subunit M [Paracoccaceae bacterium]
MFAEFNLEIPRRLNAALGLLSDGEPAVILAGGTNLLIDLRAGSVRPDRVVALGELDELRTITVDKDRITIGSRTTVTDLLRDPRVAEFAPALIDAASLFAGQMVRNTATVGGNIACSSPAADLVPPLISLDARLTLTSAASSRSVALAEFYRGYKQDVRKPDEIITRISWNRLPGNCVNRFYKLARRKGDAITVTGVAITVGISDGKCSNLRIALGSVAPTVMRARAAEAVLQGQVPTSEAIALAAKTAAAECSPIDDVRASAAYRRHTVQMLTRRLISQACAQLV